jgi:hypothetical protein
MKREAEASELDCSWDCLVDAFDDGRPHVLAVADAVGEQGCWIGHRRSRCFERVNLLGKLRN